MACTQIYWLTLNDFIQFHIPSNDLAWVPTIPHHSTENGALDSRRRKLLICHDMCGGYTRDDALPNGFWYNRPPQAHSDSTLTDTLPGFTLHYTSLVDSFIYFSHHRISVPPPQWTNLAHRHGIKSLGTILFEWAESIPDLLLFMYGDKGVQLYHQIQLVPGRVGPMPPLSYHVCDHLVNVTNHFRMDGWLLNIEVPLVFGKAMAADLVQMVAYLTTAITEKVGPHAHLIWYDAVTKDGHLAWQDAVTEHNMPFFKAASAIFTNYTWTWPQLVQSADFVLQMGRDLTEVYVGIDVFGRNQLGGGGRDCRLPQELVSWQAMSTALFAPGWVYEDSVLDEYSGHRLHWVGLEKQMWDPFSCEWSPRPWVALADGLFSTTFSSGSGIRFWVDGRKVSDAAWCNHSLQTPLPVLSQAGVSLNLTRAYFGASCIALDVTTRLQLPFAFIQLYQDSVIWLVFCGDGSTCPTVDIECTLNPTSHTKCTLDVNNCFPCGHDGWWIGTICIPPQTPASEPRYLTEISIQSSTCHILLGQLAVHRSSCVHPKAETANFATILETLDLQWTARTRALFPAGTPYLLWIGADESPDLLAGVMVQGHPWDSVHESASLDLAEFAAGDLTRVSVEWWPYYKTFTDWCNPQSV